jgi:hypothetical protein
MMINWKHILVTTLLVLPPLVVGTTRAAAQAPTRILNLEVRNVDNADSCVFASFRPEFRVTNFGPDPFPLRGVDIRMFFNNPLPETIEFVNADFVRIFNPNGTLTGAFGTAVAFTSAPPDPNCVVAADRRANQTHHIALISADPAFDAAIPPNGGFATVIVSFRRAGGLAPFDAGCDDFSKLPADPSRSFRNDRFFNLVQPEAMGPPTRLICEFTSATMTDPESGIDAGVNACGINACG